MARPQRGQASAQRAVPLTHQPADALRVGTQLGQQNMREEEKGMEGPVNNIAMLTCYFFDSLRTCITIVLSYSFILSYLILSYHLQETA